MRISRLLPVLATLLAGAAGAQTYVTGDITTDTTWSAAGNPYIVQTDVEVTGSSTLTLQAGVTVVFEDDHTLGTAWNSAIVATGEPGDRVLFTSGAGDPQPGSWRWLDLNGPGASSLAYCTVEYAEQGIRTGYTSLTVSHCLVRHCQTGIYCGQASPTITDCDVTGCGAAVWIHGETSAPVINRNNLHGNSSWNVYVTGFPAPAVTIDAEHNWWGTSDEAEIAFNIKDSQDDPALFATIDFTPWLGEMPAEAMSWGGVKAAYAR